MGRLRDIQELVNGVAPQYSSVSTKIRGLPLYIDPLLTGASRFSRKTGSIGLINPDNQIFLGEAAQINQSTVTMSRFNQWFVEDSVIELNHVEKFKILDIQGNTYLLNEKIKVAQAVEAPVNLYAVPITSVANYAVGTTTIQLRSKHQMLIGDCVAFELYKNIFSEFEILDLIDIGVSNNPFPYTYEVKLNKGIPRALEADGVFYLRAHPAYFSQVLRVPANPLSGRAIGPFVVDYFGGRITNGTSPKTFISIQNYDLFGTKVGSTSPVDVKQNHPIMSRSIDSTAMMFWDLMYGEFRLTGSNAVGIFDADGNFGVSYNAVPKLKRGDTWKISINCSTDTLLRVSFEPNDFVDYNLVAGPNTITIGQGILVDYEKLTIVASAGPGASMEFGVWQLQEAEVARISYGIMARVEKEAEWLASGLIIKPLFLTVDYLTTNYDSGDAYDAGLIYL